MTDSIIDITTARKQLEESRVANYKSGHAWRSDRVYGERIVMVRELQGWTQEDLAVATALTQDDIAAFEEEKRVPSLEQLQAIAMATGFPVPFFCSPPVQGWPAYEETTLHLHEQVENE